MPSQVGALVFKFPRTAIRIWRYSFIEAGYFAASVLRAPLEGLLLPLRCPLPLPFPFPFMLCLPFFPLGRTSVPWLDGSPMLDRLRLVVSAFGRGWMPF